MMVCIKKKFFNRHDSGVLANSKLLEQIEAHCPAGVCIYGDQGYPIRRSLITPYKGARSNLTERHHQFNADMSSLRISVEHCFGKILQYWAYLDYKKGHKLLMSPVGKIYIVAALLTNALTCLYGGKTPTRFNCVPPTLEEYFQ